MDSAPLRLKIGAPVHRLGLALCRLAERDGLPGSPLDSAGTDDYLADVWSSRPLLDAFNQGRRFAMLAGYHTMGIGACAASNHGIVVPTLMRSALESAGRAVFVLSPSLSKDERIRRWLNERLASLVEERRLFEGLDPDHNLEARDAAQAASEALLAALSAARARGLPIGPREWSGENRPDSRKIPFIGDPRPNNMATVRLIADDGIGGPEAAYRMASAVVHAADHVWKFLQPPGMMEIPADMFVAWFDVMIPTAILVGQHVCHANGVNPALWVSSTGKPVYREWQEIRAALLAST